MMPFFFKNDTAVMIGVKSVIKRFRFPLEIMLVCVRWYVQGRFPKRALAAVMEWYELHKIELTEDWARAETTATIE